MNFISIRLPVKKSLFYHRGRVTDCKKEEKRYCHCKGVPRKKDGVKCKLHKTISQQPAFPAGTDGWKEIRYHRSNNCKSRKRRSLDVIILPEDDEAVGYIYDPKPLPNVTITWPTKSGKTEKGVSNYCNATIRNSPPGKVCMKIADFNFTSFLMQCIDDIKVGCFDI